MMKLCLAAALSVPLHADITPGPSGPQEPRRAPIAVAAVLLAGALGAAVLARRFARGR